MRYLFFVLPVMWMGCKSVTDPEFIVDKSIEAHGGWDAWNALDKVVYEKSYDLYKEDGSIEQSFFQVHQTDIFPIYRNTITRTDSSVLTFDGTDYFKTKGDSSLLLTAGDTGLIHSSFYVLAQPFKLKDPGAYLTYEGLDTLFNDHAVHSVKVEYTEEGKENHPWWYYFDTNDYRLVGNMVDHNGSNSLLTNDEYVEHKGILWNKTRTGYRTDSSGNILYKRSDYMYTFLR